MHILASERLLTDNDFLNVAALRYPLRARRESIPEDHDNGSISELRSGLSIPRIRDVRSTGRTLDGCQVSSVRALPLHQM